MCSGLAQCGEVEDVDEVVDVWSRCARARVAAAEFTCVDTHLRFSYFRHYLEINLLVESPLILYRSCSERNDTEVILLLG